MGDNMEKLVLIGFMGSGKTTISRILANRFGFRCIDMDTALEEEAGMTITEIFAAEGEAGFRKRETALLRKYAEEGVSPAGGNGFILSTGGGVVVTPENRPLLKKIGRVYWLRIKPDTVLERLSKDRRRPLLQGGDRREKVEKLMKERTPMYREAADCTIDVDGFSAVHVANLIAKGEGLGRPQ